MIDLSSAETQATLKKLQRTSLLTNVLMCVLTVLAIAITVWASTTQKWERDDWAEILFFILIGVLVIYFIIIFVFELKLRKAAAMTLRKFVAEAFYARQGFMPVDGEAKFELMLAGDKLTVMREGTGDFVQCDLTPIRTFTSACASTVRYAGNFIEDYYFAAKVRPESVTVCDGVRKKPKTVTLVAGGQPRRDRSKSFNLRHGIIA